MATSNAGEFEKALQRLEQIVTALESDDVSLDDSVRLYREGRELSKRCELLLQAARDSIAAATTEEPRPPAPAPPSRPNAPNSSLFDEDVLDDDVPF